MTEMRVRQSQPLHGRFLVPGDKSISHRAVIFSALADGPTEIRGFLWAGDTEATVRCMRALGVAVERRATGLVVRGQGRLRAPAGPLDCARAGTTMRLLAGLLAGQPFTSILDGDPQLRRRPMRRVVEPLRLMGADIRDTDGHAPLTIIGGPLHGIDYTLPIASAQVKSALLLAGLFADGPTTVREPGPSRDHTERMLAAMNARITVAGSTITLSPSHSPLSPLPSPFHIPGDFSSAAFLLVAALLVPKSRITIEGVNVNPTRIGLLDVLRQMGAEITLSDERVVGGEPVADLTISSGALRGVEVKGETVVRMIDEFPIFAVAATQAEGKTEIRDAAELRVKESDRIATMVNELRKMGAHLEERPDGFVVEGPTPLTGAVVDSHGDHRVAMALAVAGLIASGETTVTGSEWIGDSFPGFEAVLAGSWPLHTARR